MLSKKRRATKNDFDSSRPRVFFRGVLFEAAKIYHPTDIFACVIAKKRVKLATSRNSLKRKIMTALREVSEELPEDKRNHTTHFLVIYVKAIPKETPYTQIKEEIQKVFATLH